MKFLGLIAVLCAALALAACGDENASSEPTKLERPTKPTIEPPPAPPKRLIVNDIEEGEGEEAEEGDEIAVEYYAIDMTGEERYSSWNKGGEALHVKLGADASFPGWDRALEGMKVGGRREILFPASLTYNLGPLFYIVDLLRFE